MKKIITVVLLLLAIMYPMNMIQADEPQTQVTSETVSLIDKGRVAFSNVTFNMSNHMSTGYTTLVMGYSTTYTIDLNNILQYFNHYSAGNVSNIYLQFELEAYYTGYTSAEYQWLSSNPDWNPLTQRVNIGTIMPIQTIAEIWWNIIGQSGGAPSSSTGSLRIRNVSVVVQYSTAIDLYTQISSLNELPSGTTPYNSYNSENNLKDMFETEEIVVPEIVVNGDYTWSFYFDFEDGTKLKAMNVVMPDQIKTTEFMVVRYFATSDYKFLWFLYTLDVDNLYNSDYVIWNITTNEFTQIVSGKLRGKPFVTGNGYSTYNMVYVDVAIPWEIDDVIQVDFSYKYRYHYPLPWPYYGKVQNGYVTRVKDGTASHTYAWWVRWNVIHVSALLIDSIFNAGWFEEDQIKDITSEYNLEKKTEYLSFFNEKSNDGPFTLNDLFPTGHKVYRFFIGQHDKFGSNAVDVTDVVALNFRYVVDGWEYFIPEPPQEFPNPDPSHPDSPDGLDFDLDKIFGGWLSDLWIQFYPIVAIALSVFFGAITYKFSNWALQKKLKDKAWVSVAFMLGFVLLFFTFG